MIVARLLQGAEIELLPMRTLFEAATRMSIFSKPIPRAFGCLNVHMPPGSTRFCRKRIFDGSF